MTVYGEDKPPIDVTKPPMTVEESAEKRFKTIKLISEDVKLLSKPQKFWDDSFIGETIADDCHPSNASLSIGALGK